MEHHENILRRIRTSGDATKESEFDIPLTSVNSFILPALNKSLSFFIFPALCMFREDSPSDEISGQNELVEVVCKIWRWHSFRRWRNHISEIQAEVVPTRS